MKTALKYFGLLLLVAGLVAFVLVASGVADSWMTAHWTCSDGHRRHECGYWEAKGSALTLAFGATFAGLVAWAIGGASKGAGTDVGHTVDLTRWTRR